MTKKKYLKKKSFLKRKAYIKWVKESDRREYRRKKRYEKYLSSIKGYTFKSPKPPQVFSFINNPDMMLSYFEDCWKHFQRWNSVDFNLSNITDLTFDALALLLAKIKDPKFFKTWSSRWKEPNDLKLKNLFLSSGFLDHVQSNNKPSNFNGEMIHHESNIRVMPKIWSKVYDCIHRHSLFSWRMPQLYNIFIEAMANTTNHAWDKCNWWLFHYEEPETNISKICFIDLWIWIIESLDKKTKTWWETFKDFISIPINSNKLSKIMNWEVEIPSSTGERKRWNWLIQMKGFSEFDNINNFTIITNNVYYQPKLNISRNLKSNFKWTFIYWEVLPEKST